MAYGYNLRQAPFGFPVVNPWPQGFQPPAPPAPIAPRPEEDPMMAGGAPGGVPGQGPMFPGLAARFPRLAQAGQRVRGFVENFDQNHPNVANFRRNNSDMLSNVGMALLTTRPGDNAPVREAFYYGRQSDQERRAAQAQAEQEAEANRIWGQFLGGGEQTTGGAPQGGAAPGDMEPYRNAIGQIESGNNYSTVGPPADERGSRAYGRYQVMDYNVGPWTQQVLGRAMTPEEFLASPEAQDRVFDIIFGGYVQQYGPDGAAQAWFGGPGSVGSGGAGSDVLGTTGNSYVAQFRSHLGQGGQPAPAGGGQPQARFTPQEQAQLQAMLSNPQTAPIAQQIIAERMFTQPEPQDLMTVNAGDTVWDPNNRQAVFTAPQEPGVENGNLTQTRNLLGPDGAVHTFGFNPETGNYDRDQGLAPADAPLVAFNGDEIPGPLLTEAIDATNEAETLGLQVQELLLFRDLAGITPTGFVENLTTGVRAALVSLGIIDDPNLPAQQVFTALQNQQALRLRNPESGFGLTGNTSNRDITFLTGAVANMANTPEANQAILTILLAKQRRAAALAALRADYIFENGSLAGYSAFKAQWIEDNSIFTPEETALLQQLAAGTTGQTPPAVAPQTQLPAGVTQQQWDVMTPAERALFQ